MALNGKEDTSNKQLEQLQHTNEENKLEIFNNDTQV